MRAAIRLRAYSPNGETIGTLNSPVEWELSSPLNDVPAHTISYLDGAPGHELLFNPIEVAVEISRDGLVWEEIPNARYIRLSRDHEVVGQDKVRKYTMPGYSRMMDKLRQMDLSNLNSEGKRPFYSATAGKVFSTLIDEAHDRGVCPGLTYDFTSSTDSSGATWNQAVTLYIEPGAQLLPLLNNLTDQGLIDWRMRGRTLQVFNADTYLSSTKDIKLQQGRDIKAMPVSASIEELIDRALIIGEGGITLEMTNPAVYSPWGGWEGFISQSGVMDEGTMRVLGTNLLAQGDREKVQYTVEINVEKTAYIPFLDYEPGDFISCVDEHGASQPFRIRQITLKRGSDGSVSISLTLNDRFIEREIRQARKTEAITGGATRGGSGGSPDYGPDMRPPAAPEGLLVSSDVYIDGNGEARAVAHLEWSPVTEYVGVGGPAPDTTPGTPGAKLPSDEPRATIVYAPHPDDETLRLSGYISMCEKRGDSFVLVAVTDGGASGAIKGTGLTVEQFKAARRQEQAEAWAALTGGRGTIRYLDLPDGGVRAAGGLAAVRAIVHEYEAQSLSTWTVEHYAACRVDDVHDDHKVVAEAVNGATANIKRFSREPGVTGGMKYLPPEDRVDNCKDAWEAFQEIGHRSVPSLFKALKDSGYVSWITT